MQRRCRGGAEEARLVEEGHRPLDLSYGLGVLEDHAIGREQHIAAALYRLLERGVPRCAVALRHLEAAPRFELSLPVIKRARWHHHERLPAVAALERVEPLTVLRVGELAEHSRQKGDGLHLRHGRGGGTALRRRGGGAAVRLCGGAARRGAAVWRCSCAVRRHRLAQPHVIAQQAATAHRVLLPHPLDPLALVRAEVLVHARWDEGLRRVDRAWAERGGMGAAGGAGRP